jgi:protein SFI1
VAHARDTFVLRVTIHKWRAALTQRREFVARADSRANTYRQKAALVFWHTRLQERRKAAWCADMRMRMQTVRSLRESALRRDVWAHWRQLYQSRLLQQRLAGHLIERCFERWKGQLREMISMKRRADEFVVARQGEVVVRCWDSWRRTAELRGAERAIAERVGARVVRESMAFWYQRMYVLRSPSRARVDLSSQA